MKIERISTIKNIGEVEVVTPKSFNELQNLYIDFLNRNHKFKFIGGGSNSLISDNYTGTIVLLSKLPFSYLETPDEMYVSAFYPTSKFATDMAKLGLDYSYLAGIPGLLGGALYNNAGSFGKNISDDVIYVTYMNSKGEIIRLNKDNLLFEYRYSVFKDITGLIVGVGFKKNKNKKINENIKNNIFKRKTSLPQAPSLGSIFKNNRLINTWRIIDQLGLRGYKIGGAEFSNKHANVIINCNKATFDDIKKLISLAKNMAYNKFGIVLEEEISIIE